MRILFTVVVAVVVGALPRVAHSDEARRRPDAAAAPRAHDPANPAIDCPLHERGVSADALRPFAETEAVKIPKAKLTAMLREVGFALRSDVPELLPYQTFLVFEKPGAGPRPSN